MTARVNVRYSSKFGLITIMVRIRLAKKDQDSLATALDSFDRGLRLNISFQPKKREVPETSDIKQLFHLRWGLYKMRGKN